MNLMEIKLLASDESSSFATFKIDFKGSWLNEGLLIIEQQIKIKMVLTFIKLNKGKQLFYILFYGITYIINIVKNQLKYSTFQWSKILLHSYRNIRWETEN